MTETDRAAKPRAGWDDSAGIVLVGEDNPHSRNPRHALYDDPPGCAGWRLRHVVFGLRQVSYHRWTRRLNLCEARWSAPEARGRAMSLLGDPNARLFVLLGRKVAGAFGFGAVPPFSRLPLGIHVAVLLPHPSGRNPDYRDVEKVARTRALLRAERPDVPWGEVDRPVRQVVRCTNCGRETTDNVCPECGFDEGGGNIGYVDL